MATGTVILDGEKLRRLRLGKGWSQYRACDELEDLARNNRRPELRVSVRTWQRAEQDLPIQASSARSIAAALAGTVDSTLIDELLKQLLVSPGLDVEPGEASESNAVSVAEVPRSIVEYLYVDERRLDAYVEQIGPPVRYDRTPTWEGDEPDTCPGAAGTGGVQNQRLTRSEKAELLLQHLQENDLLGTFRPTPTTSDYPADSSFPERFWPRDFVYETCTVRKVVVPAKRDSGPESRSLVLWLSPTIDDEGEPGDSDRLCRLRRTFKAGMLCLIADWSQADAAPYFAAASGYSFMHTLLSGLSSESPRTVLAGSEGFAVTKTEAVVPFFADPFGTLSDLGCAIGIARRVRVLYRVRETSLYNGPESGIVLLGMFAYPIFIAAEGESNRTQATGYAESSPVIRLTNYLIATALERGAGRIRVSSQSTRVTAKAGDQVVWSTDIPQQELPHVIARLKTMAGVDLGAARSVQEGNIRCTIGGHLVNLRVLVVPADSGEDCWVQLDRQSDATE